MKIELIGNANHVSGINKKFQIRNETERFIKNYFLTFAFHYYLIIYSKKN